MKARRFLPVWLPLLLAMLLQTLALALRPRQRAVPPVPTASLALPVPVRAHAPAADSRYPLRAEGSLATFAAAGPFRSVQARTDAIDGAVRFDEHGAPAALELTIDLRRLQPVDGTDEATFAAAVQRVLGLAAQDRLQFRGVPEQVTAVPQAGLQRIRWVGQLQLGPHLLRLPMDLWMVTIAKGRVRLQGAGGIDSTLLPLPRRYFLGVLPERLHITLGLDLEFQAEPK